MPMEQRTDSVSVAIAHLEPDLIIFSVAHQRALWPPVSHCTNPHCTRTERGRKLQVAESSQGVLYTLASGPVPAFAVNLRCKGVQDPRYLLLC